MGAADDQPFPQGTAQVADHDGAGGAGGGEHDGFPPLVPRLDGVVEVLDLLEVLFLGTLGQERVEESGVRALLGERLGQRGEVRHVGAVALPAPAALHAPHREDTVGGSRAARADLCEERPVLLGQPHAQVGFQLREVALGKGIRQGPAVPQSPEHLAARRQRAQRRDPLPHPGPHLIDHAQTLCAPTDVDRGGTGPARR
ncbi:hypothetical protein GCM10010398_49390 [Streptomyces fimbriatus]